MQTTTYESLTVAQRGKLFDRLMRERKAELVEMYLNHAGDDRIASLVAELG